MQETENIVIIGSGPAAYCAAIYAARGALNPVMIEGDQPGGQLTTTLKIENYPGFPEGIDGNELMLQMRHQAEHFKARLRSNSVTAVDFKQRPFLIVLDDDTKIRSKCVIIATGASPILLGLESEQKLFGRGVSSCATCDGALYRNLPVAIVGGGDTAMEDASFLSRFASKVTIIHRRDEFRASRFMAEKVKQDPKITIMWNNVVTEILDTSKNEVTGLRLKNTKTAEIAELPVAGVFMAIGHKPNTAIFSGQLALDEKGYIITDHTKTAIPGVFAAGDVQDHEFRQAITAAGSGCMAALQTERYLKNA